MGLPMGFWNKIETNRESWATTILVILIVLYIIFGTVALPWLIYG